MDCWGFETVTELPGEDFGFFSNGAAVPGPGPGPGTAPVVAPGPAPAPGPAAGADVSGTPAVAGTGGGAGTASTLVVAPRPAFTQAQTTLDTRYSGMVTIFQNHGVSGYPDAAAFRTNPDALRTWWGGVRNDPRFAADGPNPWPRTMDRDVTEMAGDQLAYNQVRDDMARTSTTHPGTLGEANTLAGRADSVLRDINGHTPGRALPGDPPPGGNPADPNRPPPLLTAANAVQQFGYLGNSVAGAVAGWGNVGYAGQYAAGGFGAGGGMPGGLGTMGYGGGGYGGGGFGGVGDLTGTNFAIGLSGGDNRSKGQRIDAMINQLLAALAAGNLDVLETAITLCNQKARMTIAGAAVNTIRAMQLYDNQMKQLSDQMGALAGQSGAGGGAGGAGGAGGNPTQMSAQLAQLNTQSSQISSGRQMIANNLRDLMTMQEEIGNTEKGIRDTMSRIKTTQSRWS